MLMKRRYQKKAAEHKRIALERIRKLFEEANKAFSSHPERSRRYVQLARKIGMKYKTRIPPELKRQFCKHCHNYILSGKNARIRVSRGKVVYYCLNCKKYMRFPYNQRKQKDL